MNKVTSTSKISSTIGTLRDRFINGRSRFCALHARPLSHAARRWKLGGPFFSALVLSILLSASARAADFFDTMVTAYASFDMPPVDGIREIESLRLLSWPGEPLLPLSSSSKLVVVLVESRILTLEEQSNQAMRDALLRYKRDLEVQGYVTRFVEAQVYSGPVHQDGRTLLALRRFFKAVWNACPGFQGAVLVGSFPEAMLTRLWIWDRTVPAGGVLGGKTYPTETRYISIEPEVIAERAEIVLADLDGDWESRYYMNSTVPVLKAVPAPTTTPWPQDNQTLKLQLPLEQNLYSFQDHFFINDADYSLSKNSQGEAWITIRSMHQRNPELSAADLSASVLNRIARPEIIVSRINARNLAVQPNPTLLDASARPRTVTVTGPPFNKEPDDYLPNAALERRILLNYFERNHRFRLGAYDLVNNYGCISKDLDGDANELFTTFGRAIPNPTKPTSKKYNASLVDYVNWLKQPMLFRGIAAHSDSQLSEFGTTYTTADLQAAVEGPAWYWTAEPGSTPGTTTYRPSFANYNGWASQTLGRALWENKTLASATPCFYIHAGCQVNSPKNASSLPYNDPHYARWQNAENVLFFLNGLAVMSRAKVFYEIPAGFGDAIAPAPAVFGLGWKAFFDLDLNVPGLQLDAAGRKRSYWWSMIGDWTLRKNYPNVIGPTSTGYMVEVHTSAKTDAQTDSTISMRLDIRDPNGNSRTLGPWVEDHTYKLPNGSEYNDQERDQWDRYFFPESTAAASIERFWLSSDAKGNGWCWDRYYVTRIENGRSIVTWARDDESPWIYPRSTYNFSFTYSGAGRAIPADLRIP